MSDCQYMFTIHILYKHLKNMWFSPFLVSSVHLCTVAEHGCCHPGPNIYGRSRNTFASKTATPAKVSLGVAAPPPPPPPTAFFKKNMVFYVWIKDWHLQKTVFVGFFKNVLDVTTLFLLLDTLYNRAQIFQNSSLHFKTNCFFKSELKMNICFKSRMWKHSFWLRYM